MFLSTNVISILRSSGHEVWRSNGQRWHKLKLSQLLLLEVQVTHNFLMIMKVIEVNVMTFS